MNNREKVVYWLSSIWSFIATVINIYAVVWLDSENVSFYVGLTGFLFCLIGHLSYLAVSLFYGAKYHMKRMSLWLYLVHPLVAFCLFTYINRKKIIAPHADE